MRTPLRDDGKVATVGPGLSLRVDADTSAAQSTVSSSHRFCISIFPNFLHVPVPFLPRMRLQ